MMKMITHQRWSEYLYLDNLYLLENLWSKLIKFQWYLRTYIFGFFLLGVHSMASDKPINTISTSQARPMPIRPWMTWKPWRHMSDAKAHTIESQQLY